MEVVVPSPSDFRFDSAASTPYVSAPSSPKRFGGDPFDYYYHYTSAPSSPSRVAAIFASSSSSWQDQPRSAESDVDDFAFDFSGQLEKGAPPPDLITADELFEEGRIRPLKPPPRLYNLGFDDKPAAGGPRSPRSPKSPTRGLWSPRVGGGKEADPFPAAMVEATRERGRDPLSSRSRKGSRSLSPMRGTPNQSSSTTIAAECLKNSSSNGSGGSSRKWRLRDLLLFRSASEGRVTGNKSKDPLRKYTLMAPPSSSSSSPTRPSSKRTSGGDVDSRNSSFRSTDSGSVGSSMRKSSVSAHEMHYVSNKAVADEMRKKTALPFSRQGLFGCLRFNPAVSSIAKGFGSNGGSYSFGRRQS